MSLLLSWAWSVPEGRGPIEITDVGLEGERRDFGALGGIGARVCERGVD